MLMPARTSNDSAAKATDRAARRAHGAIRVRRAPVTPRATGPEAVGKYDHAGPGAGRGTVSRGGDAR
jgi:hypothetical protein